MRYIVLRLIQALLLLLGVSLLSFALLELAPGDYFQEMRLNPQISSNTIAKLRAQYGLDQTTPVRYFHWLAATAHGDFGLSLAYGSPVAPLLLTRARNTLLLTVTATFLMWAMALSLGAVCAASQNGWLNRSLSALLAILLAIPELLLGLVLLAAGVRTGWFPAGGMNSGSFNDFISWQQILDLLRHLALPVTALVLGCLPVLFLHVHAALLDVLDSSFVRAALGYGIPRRRILFRHALPAALNPLLSLFGLSLASLLSVSLLTEVIMSWPGLGPLLLDAVLARDVYVVVGAILMSAIFLVVGTTSADILLYAADPRIRTEGRT